MKPTRRATIGADPLDRLAPSTDAWEYLEVRRGGSHPRSVNGRDLANPKDGPVFWDFVNELGAAGWELVAVDSDHASWIFKRRRPAPGDQLEAPPL